MPTLMTIDVSQVQNALDTIAKSAEVTPLIIKKALDVSARQRINLLKAHTPVGKRVDPRYPVKLINSYHWRSRGDTREIYIKPNSAVKKFNYVTQGTGPHVIFPVNEKALWWPGIQDGHPVAAVYNHPGTKPNLYHERAEVEYNSSGFQDTIDNIIVQKYTKSLADNINANVESGGGLGTMGTSVLGFSTLLSALDNLVKSG